MGVEAYGGAAGPNTCFTGSFCHGREIRREVLKRGILAAAFMVLLTLAAVAPAQAAGASTAGAAALSSAARSAAPAANSASLAALDVVVLVDESGSETPAKVADEKQTVGTIVQSMLNPRSRVTVVGFGGVNNLVPGQDPVDVVCQPTIASGPQNLSYLASCVSKLHRRTEQEGDDTDYAAALGQAMSYFNPNTAYGQQSPAGAIKVVLMMTDGAVDVHRDTQQYGTDWQLGEQQAINQQLTAARSDGAQVWPLGFGTDIGTGLTEPQALAYLNSIAKNGAPAVCDTRHAANQPHATWVNDPADTIAALNQLYADAACLGSNSNHVSVGGGVQTATLSVSIPAIASGAAISVDRVNPGIQVGFTLPDGMPWTDSTAITGVDSSPVEVLHLDDITSGEVGTWKIHLTAPPGLASQLVSATALWQGAVRALITANPPSAKLGQPISATLSVLGPNGPISDPATLSNLIVGITASGDGLPAPVSVPVSATGVGDYAGSFTAPDRSGTLTFTGSAVGYGLYVTYVPASVSVGTATAGFTATVQLQDGGKIQAGSDVTGQIIFTNQTGTAKRVRLELATAGADAAVTSPTGTVTAASGNPPSVPVTIHFASQSPVGLAWLQLKVVDAANPALVYNTETADITVTKPPGFLAKYLWYIVGIIALIILIILLLLWLRHERRKRVDVRGLIAILRRNGEQLGAELRAPSKWSDSFRFIIRDEGEPTARLDYPQPGSSVYSVRRSGNGELTLLTPAGERYEQVVVGGPGEHLEHNGLELAFRDKRRGSAPPVRARNGQTAKTGSSRQPPTAQQPNGTQAIPSSPAPRDKDPWL